jgi:hypothetical protein
MRSCKVTAHAQRAGSYGTAHREGRGGSRLQRGYIWDFACFRRWDRNLMVGGLAAWLVLLFDREKGVVR